MLKNNLLLSGLFACSLLFFSSCGKDKDDDQKQDYDRQAMLANQSDNLILPAFEQLSTQSAQLETAVKLFTANPNSANLQTARQAFKTAYLAFQETAPFQFGPADELLLLQNLNTFPTNTDSIRNRINSGNTNLATASTVAKGFPALDYLLFSDSNDNQVLATFTTTPDAAKRRAYLEAVSANIKNLSNQAFTKWSPAGGNYANEFKNATGTSVGSATGNLVNHLNSDLDVVKRYKVAIPSGVIGGTLRPTALEAYFSGYSKDLLHRNVLTQKNIFTGTGVNGTNGPGLDDYLDHLGTKYQDQLLSAAIIQKYDEILTKINALPEPLSQSISTHNQDFADLYQLMQNLIVLTKTDMPSAMGVSITYQDNDGD